MTERPHDDRLGAPSLSLLERQRLAMHGDESPEAVGKRLRALRMAFGLNPEHLGRACYTNAAHILAAEAGAILPNASVIGYFWTQWSIPPEFLTEGRKIDLIPAAPFERRIFSQLSRL